MLAVEGVSPSARNLADMGIRAAPSSEPWIESNIWLVRSFRLTAGTGVRSGSVISRMTAPRSIMRRSVADAAVAGGRWIVALDDGLRARLRRTMPPRWRSGSASGACLRFAEQHAEWRSFAPYGSLGLILDTASADPDMADEYLKLVARRQVPYRVIVRSKLESRVARRASRGAGDGARSSDRRGTKMLRAFAENGGLVVVGPSWGDASQGPGIRRSPCSARAASPCTRITTPKRSPGT